MKTSTVTIEMTIMAEGPEPAHKTTLIWNYCDEQQVLFLEKHMIGGLVALQTEAAAETPTA